MPKVARGMEQPPFSNGGTAASDYDEMPCSDCAFRLRVRSVARSLRMLARAGTDGAGCGGLDNAAEGRAFHVARRLARRGVAQAVAHGAELADGPVELVGLGAQLLAIDARGAIGRDH